MREARTQFKNKSPAQWLNGWEFYITKYDEVLIYKDGYFLSLDRNQDLVIFDGAEVHARLRLSDSLIRRMQLIEEAASAKQLALDEAAAAIDNYQLT